MLKNAISRSSLAEDGGEGGEGEKKIYGETTLKNVGGGGGIFGTFLPSLLKKKWEILAQKNT